MSALLNQKVRKKSFKKALTEAITSGQLTATLATPSNRESKLDEQSANGIVSTVGARLPEISEFYGRDRELRDLKKLVESHTCVLLIGVQGIGKKSLVSKLIQTQKLPFSKVLWKAASPQARCR